MSLTPQDFQKISKALSQTYALVQTDANGECKGLQSLSEAEEELKQAYHYCLSRKTTIDTQSLKI